MPPSLGLYPEHRLIKKMAVKDVPPLIDLLEEEEEEWPEAGAQNPEEAEQYMDRINNVFDHLSTLIHEDKKDALGQTIKNFKKLVTKQWEMMGDADIDIILHAPSRTPQQSTYINTLQGEELRYSIPRRNPNRP